MKAEEKLRQMGLELPQPPAPGGVYTPYRQIGDLIYISGQTPTVGGVHQVVGVVGGDLTIDDGKRAARICALNVLSILKSCLGDLDCVKQFIQVIGYVRSAPGFGDQPAVINGASELFRELYGEPGLATRLAIGANEIPGGAAVEILAVVQRT